MEIKEKKSWKISEDAKKEMREMYKDGLTVNNIANHMGVTFQTVAFIVGYRLKALKAAKTKYYQNNKEKIKRGMREYANREKKRINKRCKDCDVLVWHTSTRCMKCAGVERKRVEFEAKN